MTSKPVTSIRVEYEPFLKSSVVDYNKKNYGMQLSLHNNTLCGQQEKRRTRSCMECQPSTSDLIMVSETTIDPYRSRRVLTT